MMLQPVGEDDPAAPRRAADLIPDSLALRLARETAQLVESTKERREALRQSLVDTLAEHESGSLLHDVFQSHLRELEEDDSAALSDVDGTSLAELEVEHREAWQSQARCLTSESIGKLIIADLDSGATIVGQIAGFAMQNDRVLVWLHGAPKLPGVNPAELSSESVVYVDSR